MKTPVMDAQMEARRKRVEAYQENADQSLIRLLAYELWQGRGCPDGSDQEDWFAAEEELSGCRTIRPMEKG